MKVKIITQPNHHLQRCSTSNSVTWTFHPGALSFGSNIVLHWYLLFTEAGSAGMNSTRCSSKFCCVKSQLNMLCRHNQMSQQTESCTFHGPVDSAEQHKEAMIYQQNYQHQGNLWSPNTPNLYNNVWYLKKIVEDIQVRIPPPCNAPLQIHTILTKCP